MAGWGKNRLLNFAVEVWTRIFVFRVGRHVGVIMKLKSHGSFSPRLGFCDLSLVGLGKPGRKYVLWGFSVGRRILEAQILEYGGFHTERVLNPES